MNKLESCCVHREALREAIAPIICLSGMYTIGIRHMELQPNPIFNIQTRPSPIFSSTFSYMCLLLFFPFLKEIDI